MTGWNCHAGVEDRCKVPRPSCASSRTERRYLNPTGLSPTSCPATSRPYDRGLFHLLCVFARQPQRLIVVIDCRVNNPKVRLCPSPEAGYLAPKLEAVGSSGPSRDAPVPRTRPCLPTPAPPPSREVGAG